MKRHRPGKKMPLLQRHFLRSEGVTRFQKQVLLLELAFELFIPGVHAVREGVVAGFNIAHGDVTVTSTQRDLLTDLGFQPQAYALGEVMLTVIGETTGLIGLKALGFNASDTYPGHTVER